jgi:hypothetical protein
MSRVPQTSACFAGLIWAFVAAFGIGVPTRAADQQTAAERVESLRTSLRQDQRTYLKVLGSPKSAKVSASEYISLLRGELRTKVTELVQAAGGAEVELSIRRAAVKYDLDVIHAYEDAYGDRTIPRTSEWNVFSSWELAALEKQARSNFSEILGPVTDRPSSAVSLRLLSRVRELKWQLGGLEQERASRLEGKTPRLRAINPRVSVAEARSRFSTINSVDGSGASKHAKRVFQLEIAMQSVAAPDDASLASLKQPALWDPGTDLETGPGNRGPPWLTDPSSPTDGRPVGAPKGRAPPSLPQRLNDALIDELNAIRGRNALDRAQARARVATVKKLLGAAVWPDETPPLATLDNSQLDRLRDGYSEWKKRLVIESQSNTSGELLREIREVNETGREISLEYARRSTATSAAGPGQFNRALEVLGESSRFQALQSAEEAIYQNELQRWLRLELDLPKSVPDPRLKAAYNKARVSWLQGEVQRINALWDEANDLEFAVLRDGRGTEAARLGFRVEQSKRDLQAAARDLAERINRTFTNGGPPQEVPKLKPELLASSRRVAAPEDAIERVTINLLDARAATSRLDKSPADVYVQVRDENGQTRLRGFRAPPPSEPMPSAGEILKPTDFETLFPRGENWTRDYKRLTEETIESLRRAPGGVIVDATLSDSLCRQIDELRFNLNSSSLEVRSRQAWHTITPRLDAETLRAAYAFVLDGRVAAVDLREPTKTEFKWLIDAARRARPDTLDSDDENVLEGVLRSTISVHLHPCLLHTIVGRALIDADQLVFDLLPIADVRRESEQFKSGISLTELRDAYAEDEGIALRDSRYREALFFKSILSARNVSLRESDAFSPLEADFDFRIYHVPLRYRRSGDWFDRNQAVLKVVRPELSVLERFAIGVAICRAARSAHIANNFDVLASVENARALTPRFTITKAVHVDPKAEAILAKLLETSARNAPTEGRGP